MNTQQRKNIFIAWMTYMEGKGRPDIDSLFQYLEQAKLINEDNLEAYFNDPVVKEALAKDKEKELQMIANRKDFTEELAATLLEGLSTAPVTQIPQDVQEQVTQFRSKDSSLKDKWLFIKHISHSDGVSDFVREMCNLEAFYKVPE